MEIEKTRFNSKKLYNDLDIIKFFKKIKNEKKNFAIVYIYGRHYEERKREKDFCIDVFCANNNKFGEISCYRFFINPDFSNVEFYTSFYISSDYLCEFFKTIKKTIVSSFFVADERSLYNSINSLFSGSKLENIVKVLM
jgi:hypothetical protein